MSGINSLIQQLDDASDEKEKYRIITEMGELGDKTAIQHLINCLDEEEDNEIKSYAANAIIKIGGKKTPVNLYRLLKSPSWVTRMKAIEILGELKDKNASYLLIRALRNDSEANVREWAAISLGKLGNRKAIRHLIFVLKNEENWEVRMEAANALGMMNGKQAQNALKEIYYSDKEYRVSWAAASALTRINKDTAKPLVKDLTYTLIDILQQEKDEDMRGAAAKTLGEIGNVLAAKIMLNALKINKEFVRLEIDLALDKMAKRFNYKTKEEFIKNIK
ncbi:MAG: HEAT repeat domain-containing protein [Candidatus Heimdallarchaeota archaeon]